MDPFQLLRPDYLGALMQPLLLLAAVAGLKVRKELGPWRLFHFAFVALLVIPVVVGDGAELPLLRAAGWGLGGSPDGALAFWLPVLIALPLLTSLLSPPTSSVSRWANFAAAAAALMTPWVALLWCVVWNNGSGAGPLLGRALFYSGVLVATLALWTPVAGWLASKHTPSPDGQSWKDAILDWVPIAVVLTAYFILKLETVSYSATDEGIYFYAAKLFADGKMPYGGFFFAHPPLHVVIPGIVVLVFGYSFLLLKMLSVFFSMVSGLFIYLAGRTGPGRLAGLVAAGLFLFCLEQLQASTNLTGINLTVALLCVSTYLALKGSGLASGVFSGLAVLTGVYAAALALAIPALLFWADWKKGLTNLAALAGVVGLVNLLFIGLYGDAYVTQVYTYHFLKASKIEALLPMGKVDLAALLTAGIGVLSMCAFLGRLREKLPIADGSGMWTRIRGDLACLICAGIAGTATTVALALSSMGGGVKSAAGLGLLLHNADVFLQGNEFLRFFFFHPHFVMAPVALAATVVISLLGRRLARVGAPIPLEPALLGLALMLAALAELALLKETYTFYYVLVMPGAALVAGSAWRLALSPLLDTPAGSGPPPRPGAATSLALAGCLACTLFVPATFVAGQTRFPEEKKAYGEWVCYQVKDNVQSPFSPLVHELVLPPCRLRGSAEPGVQHYLWKKKWYFSRADEIARFIEANSKPTETVVGSSLVTPLLALLSHRTIAAGYVDTNSKRFKTGLTTDPNAWRKECDARPGRTEKQCRKIAAEREMWDRVCKTPVRFVVGGPRSFFSPGRMRNHPVIRKYFKPVRYYNEPHLNLRARYPVVLYRRVSEASAADGSYCRF